MTRPKPRKPEQMVRLARSRFLKEVRYYLNMMRSEEWPTHELGHIEQACSDFRKRIDRQAKRARKAEQPKCCHRKPAGPLHTEGRTRVWFRCDDCGRYGYRYYGEKRLRWGYLKEGEREDKFMPGLPYPEFT